MKNPKYIRVLPDISVSIKRYPVILTCHMPAGVIHRADRRIFSYSETKHCKIDSKTKQSRLGTDFCKISFRPIGLLKEEIQASLTRIT